MTSYTLTPAADLKKLSGAVIVDVRTPMEHTAQSLESAHEHVPLDQLNPKDFMLRRGLDKDDPIYFLCRSGGRARTAAEKFIAAGYPNAFVIEGGITACAASGVPVSSSAAAGTAGAAAPVPLERQVRIAAGILVVIGVALGHLVSPWFYLLAGGVGAGLVYAGVTDRCGMALMLAKAPWNRPAAAAACAMKAPDKTSGGCA